MYYPFLRGKQFELLALRAISEELPQEQSEKVLPIIEPVKRAVSGDSQTVAAMSAMLRNGIVFAYILNPQHGDFEK